MIDTHHIEAATAEEVSNIITKEPVPDVRATAQEVIDYYMRECEQVHIVRCDGCHADLCLEVLIPSEVPHNMQFHHQGMRRIVLGNGKLLSSRKRLDGAMGYECKCGNNTIAAEIELGLIPSVKNASGPNMIPEIEPHHVAMVADAMQKQGYTPDVKKIGNKTRIETFTVERLK